MRQSEVSRQLMHISGFAFVALAQFTGGLIVAAYSFMIAATFALYSEIIIRHDRRITRLMRTAKMPAAQKPIKRPFIGAMFFYLAFGALFAVLPLHFASVACIVLATGSITKSILDRF